MASSPFANSAPPRPVNMAAKRSEPPGAGDSSGAAEYTDARSSTAADPPGEGGAYFLGARRGYLNLFFSEVCGDVHGPQYWREDERVEEIQQRLEEITFRSRCVDDEYTGDWTARVEITTQCGIVLDLTRTLDEYPIQDGDTLYVTIIPEDGGAVMDHQVH